MALALGSCARSKAYQRSQEIDSDFPQSYYQKGSNPQSPTLRVEAMGQPKKRVVVFNFWNDTPVVEKNIGGFAADEIRRGLFSTQRVILPTDLRTRLETMDFLQGDKVKVAQLIREGRRLGVHVLVIGRIEKIAFRQRGDEVGILRQTQSMAAANVEMKVFDVEAGREILASGRAGEASSNSMVALESKTLHDDAFRSELTKLAVREATTQLVPEVLKAVEKMAWQGRVAKVVGTKVYINSGQSSGLVGGDILRVLTPGEDVYDPASGAYLGHSQGQLKGTLELVDFIGEDASVAVLHTGGRVEEGDVVRLY